VLHDISVEVRVGTPEWPGDAPFEETFVVEQLSDGRFIAPLDALGGGVALSPGAHRLELRHEDYFSSYLELQLARAERKRLALDLAAILP